MEFFVEREKKERAIERLVLLFFTIYDLLICYVGISNKWDLWTVLLMVLCLVSSWGLWIARYSNYSVRALVTTLLIQVCLFIYSLNSQDFVSVIPTLFVISIIISMYGVTDLVVISNIVQVFLVLLFLVTGKSIIGEAEYMKTLPQVGNIFIFLFLMYFWVKKRNENVDVTMQMIHDMEKAEQSKDDFLANVSHEIRTPLNTIYGMTQMAQKQTDPDVIREEIYNIEVASKKLMSMVNDILDFSELQSGEMELEEEVYNISSTINDVINMTMAAVAGKKLEVIVDFDASMPALLEGDEKKIRRIIMNFVSNAAKFTNSGYIGIKVSGRKETYGINLSISVTDSGIGISDEHIDKVFSEFGQLDTRRNRQESGVGLGLAISSLLAQKMGGVITVSSKLGRGSTFTLIVPQKVVKEHSVVSVKNGADLSIACYFNLEKQDIAEARDAYAAQIQGLIKGIPVNWHYCKNLDELKRRIHNEKFTHVFISEVEYEEDRAYFDTIAKTTKLMISIPRGALRSHFCEEAIIICRPIYALPLVAALNDEYDIEHADKPIKNKKFTAPSAHVLVVDDNMMNIRVIENILAQFKITVTKALSGSEALEKVESMNYDFIFMDHMMPEMDGVETTHRIREKVGSYYQRVPIIALTANAVAGSRKMFLSEGFSDFLEKPVELSVLERVLRRTLPAEKMIFTDVESNHTTEVHSISHDTDISQIKEVDCEIGARYCGGEESFYMIMAECVLNADETASQLDLLFSQKDWKNYIIKIHALKSTLKSVGIMGLSDRAKKLEFAGKEGNYQIIEEEHESVLSDYRSLMGQIRNVPQIDALLQNEEDVSLVNQEVIVENSEKELVQEISEAHFKKLYMQFEDAMYSLDRAIMLQVLDELRTYTIGNEIRKKELDKIQRKVTQEDYFSAGSDLNELSKFVEGGK